MIAEAAVGALEAAAAEFVTVEAAMEVAVEAAVEAAVMDPQQNATSYYFYLDSVEPHRRFIEITSTILPKPAESTSRGGASGWSSFLTALYLPYTRPDVSGSIVDFCLLPAAVLLYLVPGTMGKQYRIPDKKHTYLVPAVGWLSYLCGGTFYTDFSTTAPELLISPKISTWLSYYCTFNI